MDRKEETKYPVIRAFVSLLSAKRQGAARASRKARNLVEDAPITSLVRGPSRAGGTRNSPGEAEPKLGLCRRQAGLQYFELQVEA